MKKNQKGITLVAMVITIIVMLILAGVSIAGATSQNGVATKGKEGSVKSTLGSVEEKINLAFNQMSMDYESAWIENSSIAAYKGIFVTAQRLNRVLEDVSVYTGYPSDSSKNKLDPKFTVKQNALAGTVSDDTLKSYIATDEYPICQVAFATAPTAATPGLNGLKNPNSYFSLYLTNKKAENGMCKDLGSDVYVAICSITDGMPKIHDLGLVQGAVTTTDCVNKKQLNITQSFANVAGSTQVKGTTTSNGLTDIIWLHQELGLKKLPQ